MSGLAYEVLIVIGGSLIAGAIGGLLAAGITLVVLSLLALVVEVMEG